MAALLAFAPFITFALVEKLCGPVPGLAAGALASVALLLRDRWRGEPGLNVLEAGSAGLFSLLGVLALAGDAASWSMWQVRFWVDLGLLLIVLLSIVLRRPFTLQHARRRVSAEIAESAAFLRMNNRLSGAWAMAFLVLVVADALMVLRPQTPVAIAVGLSLAALVAAGAFTARVAAGRQRQPSPGRRPSKKARTTGSASSPIARS